jgi:glycosyltransferase involved in cell wall biosynthesis
MKILHIGTCDLNGGAARASYRLHIGLRRLGHDSAMYVAYKSSNDPAVLEFRPPAGLNPRLRRGLRSLRIRRSMTPYQAAMARNSDLFSDDRSPYGSDVLGSLPDADVVNLHWFTNFIDYQAFFTAVPLHKPVVWTLHDMNPLTGGCHYDEGCGKYVASCGSCPQLGSHEDNDLSRQIWCRKHNLLNSSLEGRLTIATNSRWLAAEARRSSLLSRFPITTVHYGLDCEAFAPRNRAFSRSVLGIPADASVVLFAADWMNTPRKGFSLLCEALAGLESRSNLLLLSIGRGESSLPVSIPHLHLGYITNDQFLSVIYSAADIFVIPSLQEAFGQTALESIACGTPVVGFATGGIVDIVQDGVNGRLVAASDVNGLRAAIVDLLQDPERRSEMSARCRRIATEEFGLEDQARRYVELYESMLTRTQTAPTFAMSREHSDSLGLS